KCQKCVVCLYSQISKNRMVLCISFIIITFYMVVQIAIYIFIEPIIGCYASIEIVSLSKLAAALLGVGINL
ncbi:TPA: hypothetical protein ACPQBJ_001556, partial [Haemophilus influenzae]